MVQRKVSNKLGTQPKNTLKTEKRHVTINPSLQNYDGKSKGVDLKAIRMKKSRSIKRLDVDFSLRSPPKTREVFRQPGEPPTVGTPTKTPSPKNPLLGNKSSPYSSPNYMKGTSSSEARKEKETTLKLNTKKLGKSSSLKKVRTLTKAPSFKHTRTGTHNKKMVLCENLEAQRATCSSTLKDSKFPSYLKLTPGATEAEGTSVMKVCPYNYCSLNGHRHTPASPLKSFLTSRRRMLKTQKNVKPEAFSPGKRKRAEIKVTEDQKDDFFVEIHVPKHDPDEISEIDFQGDVNLSDMNFSSEEKIDENCRSILLLNQASHEGYDDPTDLEMDSDSSASLDQLFGKISDMEWEEGEITKIHDEKVEVPVEKDYGDDETEPEFELEKFLAEKLLPYIQDEIMECLHFSDADTLSDSESPLTDGDDIGEQVVDDETIWTSALGEESIEEQHGDFSSPIEEVTEANNEDPDYFKVLTETYGEELEEDLYIGEETKDGIVMEERISSESETENEVKVGVEEQILMDDNDSQAEVCHSETENTDDASLSNSAECQEPEENLYPVEDDINCVNKAEQKETEAKNAIGPRSTNSDQEHYSNEVKLHSYEKYVVEVKAIETEEINQTEEEATIPAIGNESQLLHKGISDMGNDSIDELLDCCNKLKRSVRCKILDEDCEDSKDFNPRPPNFLPVEPEPEPEKVDLRHQDMDERRNAEDWMLDHALQKTVNQLATARKRKVSLLVEAFESVLPVSKYEPHMRRNSSGFAHARPIQACN